MTQEDPRAAAIIAIIARIGRGITWETADTMITNLLKNWK